ncbi:MAG: tetratricopeptide repeat protein [Acidobacteriota bacterium]|nr:tetratricopeptide repeat protein [Acidobacteriota bacterium]
MDIHRWQRLEELWDQVSALPENRRRRFLDELHARDPALAKELEQLLEAAEDDQFLQAPLLAQGASEERSENPREDPWEGRRVGRYRLLQPIGEGGMSRVYLARQEGVDFERPLAVKLLRGLSLPEADQRLVAERRILASLEHPNIARFLDGGSTEDGIPFVAMEYVPGLPITEHCWRSSTELRDVLELFRKACEAVQFAHSHLVVHRDLKPANLLVTESGEPKLLDFGLAKLLDESGLPTGERTATQYRALTPSYASPEQIAGRTVTTATDVYSLGVLLYELLAGERPHDPTGLSPAEMQRRLETAEPLPPSQCLHRRPGATGSASGPRWRSLPQDLDRIALKALRPEPSGRYPSAQALADDIQRFLDGQPVHAQAQTWGYRLGKFVGRNRAAVVLAVLLALSLMAFAVTAALQAQRLRQERNTALQEQERAEEAVAFVEHVFQTQNPHSEAATRAGMKDLLDTQQQRVLTELANQPELQVRLASTLGLIYQNQGFFPEARELLEHSLEQATEAYGPRHLRTARIELQLGNLLTNSGDLPAAQEHLLSALKSFEMEMPRAREELSATHSTLGHLLRLQGDNAGAEEEFRQSVELLEERPSKELARRMGYLASLLQKGGNLGEAERLARRALALSQATGSELDVAEMSNILGDTLRNATRYREAEEHLHRALEIYRRRLGGSAETATVLNNLGIVLRSRGDYRGSRAAYEEGLTIMRQIHGDDHVFIAVNQANLGRLERILADFPRAEARIQDALRIHRLHDLEDHPYTGFALKALAELRRDQGRWKEALELAERADSIFGAQVAPEHPWRSTTRLTRGTILLDQGRLDAAEEELLHSKADLEQELGAEAPPVADVQAQLARLEKLRGRLDDAADLYRQAAQRWREVDEEHPERGLCLAVLADIERSRGRNRQAREALEPALPILRNALPPEHPGLLAAERTAGEVFPGGLPGDRSIRLQDAPKQSGSPKT